MGLFGDFFDSDGDGKASMFEELMGLEVLGLFDSSEDDTDDDEEDEFDDEND